MSREESEWKQRSRERERQGRERVKKGLKRGLFEVGDERVIERYGDKVIE